MRKEPRKGPSGDPNRLPGAQPQTLAELASTSDRSPAIASVTTAEALRPKTHSRLVLKGQEANSAENAFLRGIHYMGVITTNLYDKTHHSNAEALEVAENNVEATLAIVKPSIEVLLELQVGIGILNTLVQDNTGIQRLHSVQEAKALFGHQSTKDQREAVEAFDGEYKADSPFGKFVAEYDYAEAGVRAEEVIAAFLEKSFGRVKSSSYEEPPVQEVILDFLGTDSLIETVTKDKLEVDVARAESATDPLGLDENNRRVRITKAFSLVSHEWRTPITALLVNMQLAERVMYPPKDRPQDMTRAASMMNKVLGQIGRLEQMRQHMYDALQKGFVPAEIPVSQLLVDTTTQLVSHLGENVSFWNPYHTTDATVSISPSAWSGIINNAVQNAQRARQAWLINEEGVPSKEAEERARNEVHMLCSVMINRRDDTLRILMTDDGRGITRGRRTHRFADGDHGFDAEGVESNGIAMHEYAEYVRSAGGDLYLLQTPYSTGATLVARLPLHISQEAIMEQ